MRRMASVRLDSRTRSASISWSALVGVLQLFTAIRLRSTLYPGLSGPGWMGRLDLGRAQPGSTHFTKTARNTR